MTTYYEYRPKFQLGYLFIFGKFVECPLISESSCITNDLTYLGVYDVSLPAARSPAFWHPDPASWFRLLRRGIANTPSWQWH